MSGAALAYPFYRIARPHVPGQNQNGREVDYLCDDRYAKDRVDFLRSYHYLEHDLLEVFEFIEPSDDNRYCYSHRLFALLLRAATEFEANAKAILHANGYCRKRLTIKDYHKIEIAARLSEYFVSIPIWRGTQGRFQPFAGWDHNHTLQWYQAYNDVKHNRSSSFKEATLQNVCNAVSAVFAILFSQFHFQAFSSFQSVGMYRTEDDVRFSHVDTLMAIEPAHSWTDEERYSFDWPTIAKEQEPFQRFQF